MDKLPIEEIVVTEGSGGRVLPPPRRGPLGGPRVLARDCQ